MLFKYYALSSTSLDALENLYIYATHPAQFSDELDCSQTIVTIDDVKSIEAIFDGILTKETINMYDFDELKQIANDGYYEIIYRKLGVVSLTDTPHNNHLWDKYAKDDGFCIGFNTFKIPFKKWIFSVAYEDFLPNLRISKTDIMTSLLVQCLVKTKEYEKEQEWRMLVESPEGIDMQSFGKYRNVPPGYYHDRKFKYSIDSVECVILGGHFFGDKLRQVSQTEYSVEFTDSSPQLRVLHVLQIMPFEVYWRTYFSPSEYVFQNILIVPMVDEHKYRIIIKSTNQCIY